MAKRITRELQKLAKKYDRTLEATAGHYKLHGNHGQSLLTCSATPANLDNMLREVERDLRKYQKRQSL